MNKVFVGSPNFTSGRERAITGMIIHWMAGNLASTDAVFQNRIRNTSAHYGIEDDQVHQYVKEEDTAYHAGNWVVNTETIGIEHSAQPGRAPSDATYETSAQIIADAAKEHGFPIDRAHIRKHKEIVATQCPGEAPDGVDIDRLIKRAKELAGAHDPQPVPVPSNPVLGGVATVVVDQLNVRTAPNTSAPLGGSKTLVNGDTFQFTKAVQGESVQGISTWLVSTKGNYCWAGGTNIAGTPATTPPVSNATGGTAQAIRTANVRSLPNTSAPLAGSQTLNPGDQFIYSGIVDGQNVSQNGVTSNKWYHSSRGNYVWIGNAKKV